MPQRRPLDIEGAPLDDPYVPYQWKRKLSGSRGGGRYVERGECALRGTLVEGAIGPMGRWSLSRDQVYAVDRPDPAAAPPTDPARTAICMLESGDIVAVTVLTVEYSPWEAAYGDGVAGRRKHGRCDRRLCDAHDPEEAKQQRREQARMWAAKALSRDEEMRQPCKVPLLGFALRRTPRDCRALHALPARLEATGSPERAARAPLRRRSWRSGPMWWPIYMVAPMMWLGQGTHTAALLQRRDDELVAKELELSALKSMLKDRTARLAQLARAAAGSLERRRAGIEGPEGGRTHVPPAFRAPAAWMRVTRYRRIRCRGACMEW
jgi:hypothetical protein